MQFGTAWHEASVMSSSLSSLLVKSICCCQILSILALRVNTLFSLEWCLTSALMVLSCIHA